MRTFIITGGNSGLGFETAKRILSAENRVILACRNIEKGNSAAEQLKKDAVTILKYRNLIWLR